MADNSLQTIQLMQQKLEAHRKNWQETVDQEKKEAAARAKKAEDDQLKEAEAARMRLLEEMEQEKKAAAAAQSRMLEKQEEKEAAARAKKAENDRLKAIEAARMLLLEKQETEQEEAATRAKKAAYDQLRLAVAARMIERQEKREATEKAELRLYVRRLLIFVVLPLALFMTWVMFFSGDAEYWFKLITEYILWLMLVVILAAGVLPRMFEKQEREKKKVPYFDTDMCGGATVIMGGILICYLLIGVALEMIKSWLG